MKITKAIDAITGWHSARIHSPEAFKPNAMKNGETFATKKLADGLNEIIGILKEGTGKTTVQAYLFDADKYTVAEAEAKAWLSKSDVKFTLFTPSKKKSESSRRYEMSKIVSKARLTKADHYDILTYDVWGNEEDGFEVNNIYGSGYSTDINPNDSDESILKEVCEVIGGDPSLYEVSAQSDETTIYIDEKETGKPVGELRRHEELSKKTASIKSKAEYNGWTNYETWLIALWIDNEQSDQEYWRDRAKELHAEDPENCVYRLADELKDQFEEANPLADSASFWLDLILVALAEVNWYEVAKNICEELDNGPVEEAKEPSFEVEQ